MRRTALFAFLCFVSIAVGRERELENEVQRDQAALQSAAGDLAALEGTWKPTFARRGLVESSAENLEQFTLAIRNSRYGSPKSTVGVVEVRLDSTQSPKQIDFVVVEGRQLGSVVRGVYELDGDELKVCYGFDSRPTKLEWKADDNNLFLVTYRRV